MTRFARAVVIALGFALSVGTVLAQPAPPDPGGGSGDPTNTTPKDDNLGQGAQDERPWAKGVSKERQTTALRAFSEANRHLNNGLFPAALEKYKEALRSWEHPAIFYNMALALRTLDQPIELENALLKAVEHGPAPIDQDKFDHAKAYLAVNAKALAWIEVSCKKIGANVLIDGAKVFTVEAGKPNKVEMRVRVGKHTIVAERTGYNAQVDAPYIEPGQKFRIELQLYTSEELTRYKRRWEARWMPLAVIGGGVLLAVTGAVLESSANTSYNEFDQAIKDCNDASGGAGCMVDSSISDIRDSGDTKKTMGYVMFGIAGAAVITGTALLYLNRRVSYEITADEYRREQSKSANPRPVAITPILGPNTAGAMIHGRF
ncbi:MAG: hypothetical protein H0V17_33670 [Deltaproteobacteria bacterium]|nr:hypothetical protein [Deltaproteobacteria bacterium]